MTWRQREWAVAAAGAFVLAWALSVAPPGERLEFALADSAASFLRHEVDSDIVIIAIDARSLAELEEWPWPRSVHADLLERLAPAAPRQLFIDIDFSSRSDPDEDERLRHAVASWTAGPLILPVFLQPASVSSSELVLTRPLPMLQPHAILGSVNLMPASDGLVRTVPNEWTNDSATLPSVTQILQGSEVPETGWIDYTIDPASFRTVSYSDVLGNRVAAQHFADKTVMIGATAIELGDSIPAPVYQSLPGVVVQALALQSARDGLHQPLPAAIYWPLVAAWAAMLSVLFRRRTWRRNGLVLMGALVLGATAALVAYTEFRTIVRILPLGVSAVAVFVITALRSLDSEALRALAYAMGFRQRNALLKSIVLSSTDCIVCIDGQGIIRTANPAASGLFACATRQLTGQSLLRYVPALMTAGDGRSPRRLDHWSGRVEEFTAVTSSGEEFPVELSVSRVHVRDEALYTVIIRDISERKAQQRQLQFQATHDPLTTLPNRSALAAHLDTLLQSDQGRGRVALLMIDLDRFKEVNDTLGHNVGDYVLHDVAARLEKLSRDAGFIARIGGDEFALVVDRRTDRASLEQLSGALVDCLKRPVETCGVAIEVGLSVGISCYPDDATSAEELFRHSDVAMYVAKRSNSGFEFYDADNDEHSIRRLEIAGKLRGAIAAGDLELHYQPQVNLRTGRVESVEALLRWDDPALGSVGPDEFVTLAETTDMIQPLSNWTLEQAFRQAIDWRDLGYDLRIAVNVSARLLQDAAFPERVAGLLRRFGVTPSRIELEITESSMMVDPERARQITTALSELGVHISIDDYGTGYSSLAYLRDLPVSTLKLDRSFVLDMQHHEGDRVIAASTVQMAHALKLEVVAEGVETAAVAAMLRDLGYDYGQGYLYSPALEADALIDWLNEFDRGRVRTLA